MLRIYLCPQCYNFRLVSRKPDAICFHCGTMLIRSELEYSVYIQMSEEERNKYKQQFIQRMKAYYDKMNMLSQEKNKKIDPE